MQGNIPYFRPCEGALKILLSLPGYNHLYPKITMENWSTLPPQTSYITDDKTFKGVVIDISHFKINLKTTAHRSDRMLMIKLCKRIMSTWKCCKNY